MDNPRSQKDFTIEERLNEESFVSRTNLNADSKTIELADHTHENYGSTGGVRLTMQDTIGLVTRDNLNELSGKIRIENNLIMTSSHQSQAQQSVIEPSREQSATLQKT